MSRFPLPILSARIRVNDLVTTKQQWEHCKKYRLPETELEQFRISAMELMDSVTPNSQLLSEPYWRYGIRSNGTRELIWLSQKADGSCISI